MMGVNWLGWKQYRCDCNENATLLCGSADCRSLALKFDFVTAMKLHNIGRIDIRVWDQGNKLLEDMRKNIKRY